MTYIRAITGKTGEMPEKILLSSQISFSWQQVRYLVIVKEHILAVSLFSCLIIQTSLLKFERGISGQVYFTCNYPTINTLSVKHIVI